VNRATAKINFAQRIEFTLEFVKSNLSSGCSLGNERCQVVVAYQTALQGAELGSAP